MNKKILFLIILTLVLFPASTVFSAGTIEQLPSNASNLEYLLENPSFDILVISVLEINNENTTNTNPPTGKLKIEEVLRSKVKSDIINIVLRAPSPEAEDYKSGNWKEGPLKNSYNIRSLVGPKVNEKLIVFLYPLNDDSAMDAEIVDFYKFTKEGKEIVVQNMYEELSGWIQNLLAIIILILPIINLVLYLFIKKVTSIQIKNRLKKVVFLIPLLATILYLFYEAGVSPYYYIRVDLFLIYPAIILNFSFWLILLVQSFRSKNKMMP